MISISRISTNPMQMDFSSVIKKMIIYGLENTIGRYYSIYRGFVYDNNDPENLNRLQILVPHINSKVPDRTWAYPKNQFSGKGYGMHILPKKGDMVWVEYEFGDVDYPTWSFGHYAENEKPRDFGNDRTFGFKTPRGSLVYMDDTEGSEVISIKLKGYKDTIDINIDKMTIESKLILVGKEAKEWAAKGDTTQKKIEELTDIVKGMATDIATHQHTAMGASPPTNVVNFTKAVTDLTDYKTKVKDILSTKVKVE